MEVDFVNDNNEFWDQIRVLNFEAWNVAKTEHFHIVEDGKQAV